MGIAIGGTGTLAVVALLDDPTIRLGSLAEWVAGLGTIGALIYAGLALRHEMNARRADEMRYVTARARDVRIWVGGSFWDDSDAIVHFQGSAVVENASRGDIRDVDIRASLAGVTVAHWPVEVLRADARWEQPLREQWPIASRPQGQLIGELRFTDPDGWRWLRKMDGTPREPGPPTCGLLTGARGDFRGERQNH